MPFKYVSPEICGKKWQEDYQRMHSISLTSSNTESRRYAFNMPIHSGGADNIQGMVTMLLISLLSSRIFFQITPDYNHIPTLTYAYEPATFNWNAFQPPEHFYTCMISKTARYDGPIGMGECYQGKLFAKDNFNSTVLPLHLVNVFLDDKFLNGTEMIDFYSNYNIVTMANNRGHTLIAYQNTLIKSKLESFGLHKLNLFGCLFSFLLKPKPEVCELDDNCQKAYNKILTLKSDRSNIIIAIQVRRLHHNVDNVIEVDCAIELGKQYHNEQKLNVYYILQTQFESLQEHLHHKLGDKLILPSWIPTTPTTFADREDRENKDKNKQGTISYARDVYIASYADVHIISMKSALGLQSALMRVRPADEIRIYKPNNNNHNHNHRAHCKIGQSVTLEEASTDWSGL
jgi:hypothetical protein